MQHQKSQFLESVHERMQDGCRLVSRDVTLKFISRGSAINDNSIDSVNNVNNADAALTVLRDCVSADHCFNEAVYRHHLNTQVLGNVVLYADVITTTMSLLEGSAWLLHHVSKKLDSYDFLA